MPSSTTCTNPAVLWRTIPHAHRAFPHWIYSSLPCFFPSGPATPCFSWQVPLGVVRQPHCTHLRKTWLSPLLSGSTLTQTLFCPGIQVCYKQHGAIYRNFLVLASVVCEIAGYQSSTCKLCFCLFVCLFVFVVQTSCCYLCPRPISPLFAFLWFFFSVFFLSWLLFVVVVCCYCFRKVSMARDTISREWTHWTVM